jgi:hypothetical protein
LLVEGLADLERGEVESLRQVYEECAELRPGEWIHWRESGREVRAEVVGLGPFGELQVREAGAEHTRSILADEVSKVGK